MNELKKEDTRMNVDDAVRELSRQEFLDKLYGFAYKRCYSAHEAADFLYLGDTKVDMTCACSAGMNPVGVLWGFRTAQELLDNGAKVLIAHPMELLEKFNL